MAFTPLKTNYTDAVWTGLKKYTQVNNTDGTVSFEDKTAYTNKENSFFGAMDANKMNEALNHVMTSLENGTNLYTEFQTYFNDQKRAFQNTADTENSNFQKYVATLKQQGDLALGNVESDYVKRMTDYEHQQQAEFNAWFNNIRNQLGADVAGGLQNQIDAVKNRLNTVLVDNAGAHNATYRGKWLGRSVTPAQYAAIANGTFQDMYVGDYWGSAEDAPNYTIAGFDYFLNQGDTKCVKHHIVVVTDGVPTPMNDTNDTTTGYLNSRFRQKGVTMLRGFFESDFAGHVLKHRERLVSKVVNGKPSEATWADADVELLNENMVFGSNVFGGGFNVGINTAQLPLYALNRGSVISNQGYYLRDIASLSDYVMVTSEGDVTTNNASLLYPVKVYACIC